MIGLSCSSIFDNKEIWMYFGLAVSLAVVFVCAAIYKEHSYGYGYDYDYDYDYDQDNDNDRGDGGGGRDDIPYKW